MKGVNQSMKMKYPSHGLYQDQINKGIGDTVEVEYGNEKARFLVTGISQAIGNSGQVAALTLDGIQQLQSDYKGSSYMSI